MTAPRLVCLHVHCASDEGHGVVGPVVRWRCVDCGTVRYSDDRLALLRVDLATARARIAELTAALEAIRDRALDEVGDPTV